MDNQEGSGTPKTEGSNRGTLVAALTPLLAVMASWVTGLVAEHIPGAQLDPTQVTAVMVATVTTTLGVALKWLHGWQQHESRVWDGKARPVKALSPVAEPGPADIAA